MTCYILYTRTNLITQEYNMSEYSPNSGKIILKYHMHVRQPIIWNIQHCFSISGYPSNSVILHLCKMSPLLDDSICRKYSIWFSISKCVFRLSTVLIHIGQDTEITANFLSDFPTKTCVLSIR